jgi:hypothetical protein
VDKVQQETSAKKDHGWGCIGSLVQKAKGEIRKISQEHLALIKARDMVACISAVSDSYVLRKLTYFIVRLDFRCKE